MHAPEVHQLTDAVLVALPGTAWNFFGSFAVVGASPVCFALNSAGVRSANLVTPCFSLPTALRASIVASVSLKMEKRAIVSCSELYGVPPRCWRMKRSNCGNCGSEAMSEVEESEKPMRESIFCMVCALHGRQKAVSHLEVRPSTQGWIIWWARCAPAAGYYR